MTEKKFFKYDDRRIAYVDEGEGDPIIFFHGNPTSSFLYRNIIKNLKNQYRCIAADMLGMVTQISWKIQVICPIPLNYIINICQNLLEA